MAIEASFTVSESEFPLGEIFLSLPGATIELDRLVPTNHAIIPYFWIHNTDDADIEFDGEDHPGVNNYEIIDVIDEQQFVRIEWVLEHMSVLTALIETDVTLLSAVGKQGNWTFELRGDSQESISEFQSYCREHDIPITLTQLHALSPLLSAQPADLTEGQREALVLAYARGYFDSPRRASQEAVALELGISRQALSSRLQRGIRRLIASTVVSPE